MFHILLETSRQTHFVPGVKFMFCLWGWGKLTSLTVTVTGEFVQSGFSNNHIELHLDKTIILLIILFPHICRKALEKPFKMQPFLNFNLPLKLQENSFSKIVYAWTTAKEASNEPSQPRAANLQPTEMFQLITSDPDIFQYPSDIQHIPVSHQKEKNT